MINAEDYGFCDLLLSRHTSPDASEDVNQHILLDCTASWPSIIIAGSSLATYNVTSSLDTGR
jgi:hypothetical protein